VYETLLMLKPGQSFTPKEMAALVREVSAAGEGRFESQRGSCAIRAQDAYLQIDFADGVHIKQESGEIAAEFGIPCANCTVRYEMEGNDPDMQFFNDYLLINEKLYVTGKFVIFDQVEGKEFTA
jgi:hypothetical protein